MTNYIFQSTAYRNQRDMHYGIASDWISAGGQNTPEFIREVLASETNESLAEEVLKNWDMPDGFERDMLVEAFDTIRSRVDTEFPLED